MLIDDATRKEHPMARSGSATLVFAGDQPGSWWLVHGSRPRFAGRLLSIEAFNAEPRYAAILPHGLSAAIPVHFKLGSDVLVVTDFIDPVTVAEGDSPQKAILSQPMLDALHDCSQAIIRIAAGDPTFATLAERAEQFLVGWRLSGASDDALDLLHASGAQVRVQHDADGGFSAALLQPPAEHAYYGWAPELLHDRLQRIAGERALLLLANGCDRLPAEDGSVLDLDRFTAAGRAWPHALHWTHGETDGVCYAVLQCDDPRAALRCRLEVEIEPGSALTTAAQPLTPRDVEAILSLVPMYGLHGAVNLLAAHRFAWFEDSIDAALAADDETESPAGFPCEVELLIEGESHAAVTFAPADSQGRYRLVIAPQGPPHPAAEPDSSVLLPFECVNVDRRRFHLPAYLGEGGRLA
jgi:hypothetical protein